MNFLSLKNWTLALMVFVFVQSSKAQETKSYSLQDAVNYALQNNVNVKNSKLDYLSTKKKVTEVLSIGLPSVNAGADYTNFFALPVQLIPGEFFGRPGTSAELKFGKPQNFKLGFDASQLIFDGRYLVGVRATKDLVVTSQQAITKSEIDTRKQVMNSYYGAIISQESYKLVQTNVATLERILFETRELYKQGFVEELDVNRLELALSNLKTTIKDVENKSKNAMDALKFNMGVDLNEQIVLTENLDNLLAKAEPMTDLSFSPENRIEYSLLTSQKTLLGYDVKQKKMGYYPSMYTFVSYYANAQRDKFNFWNNDKWFRTGIWGVSLKIPIFDSFLKDAQIQQAKIKQAQAINTLDNFKQASQLEVLVTKNNYEHALDALADQKKNMELATKIHNKSLIMFKEGVGTSYVLAQSDADMVTAQLNYIQAIYGVLTSKTDLESALGKLNN